VGILSNARCLNEGVDVRAIDCIAFIQPRRSKIDIVQAVGRALRKDRDNKVATITIPIFIEDEEDADTALSSSRFEPVWAVLQALREHDDILTEELDTLRYELGRRGGSRGRLPGKIVISMPTSVGDKFLRAFGARIVDTTTSSWEFWFGLLVASNAEHGNVDILVSHTTEGGFRLGRWVDTQRTLRKRGKLSDERIARLDGLGFSWEPHDEAWERYFDMLVAYKEEHGHVDVPSDPPGVYGLRAWLTKQRGDYKTKELPPDRYSRLRDLDIAWDPRALRWPKRYSQLLEYRAKYGHVNVRQQDTRYLELGAWVAKQRRLYKGDELQPERKALLDKVCFSWDLKDERWDDFYTHLLAYHAEYGHVNVKRSFVSEDGYTLGIRVGGFRERKKNGKLSAERIKRLEDVGFVWRLRAS
jgi:hypothetical protein